MSNDTPSFAKRFRIQSSRMPKWNYAGYGTYFVTICTHERRPWFGHIQNGMMCLSDIGSVIADEWTKTSIIRSYVELDTWVVMPDHFHGIMTIHHYDNDEQMINSMIERTQTPQRGVSTGNALALWKPGSLGTIMNQFKSICTKRIRAMGHPDFTWQPRFHDRVIRSYDDMNHFRRYIKNNPSAWSDKH